MSIESGDYHFAPPYTDKFKEDLLRAIIEKNSSDPSPPSEANIQDLRVHNDNDALDLNSRLVSVAKHIYDVPSRDGKSTSTALQGRINLSEVNEKSLRDENELSLQTFYLSNKGKSHKVQLLRLEEQVDGKFEKHRQEQGNTLSDKFFGTHVARSLSYKTAADEVLSSTEDGRFLTMVEYFLLPNRFKMTPISYSNEHHNEEYLGDDENGFPTFADKAPVDEEELLCPTSFSRNELRVDEDSDGEDDDDIDSIVSRERESIGMCKAMIIFQLTVIGSVRGGKGKKKKKNRRNRTPPRGNIGAVFDGNATDEEG